MRARGHNSERGASRLRVILVLAAILVAGYGAYKLIPWAWGGWRSFAAGLTLWWRVSMADPIFQGIIRVLAATRGSAVAALCVIAFAPWALTRAMGVVTSVAFRKAAKQQQMLQENFISQMESVQGKLKRLFADDIEKIALFGGKVCGDQPEVRTGNPLAIGCLGCLPGALWMLISTPFLFMIHIAIFDGLYRLFVSPEPLPSLLASAGSHAGEAQALLPVEKSVSLAGALAINLSERSLPLSVALCLLGLLSWLVHNISNSGWTLPRLTNFTPLFTYLLFILLSYWFLNSALLIFAIAWIFYSFVFLVLVKFLFRPAGLRLKALLAPRARPGDTPAQELVRVTD